MIKRTFFVKQDFKNTHKLLKDYKSKPESYWGKQGEKRALELFHQMAERVPAYKDFLKKNNSNPKKIVSITDFAQLPTIDKDNYLRKYPLEKLCWDGKLKEGQWTIAATSGSTGDPFYFPRQKEQDLQYALTAELYLLNNFQIDKQSTLYIDGFGMGVWIGGVFTYEAIKLVAENGKYPLSIITPGSSKEEIIKAVQHLGDKFDQIIIGGYPPLVKDTIDDGMQKGLNWKKYPIKFIFSAEGFSETFRDYIIERTGLKNEFLDTLNHYGTVDLGTMAHETPLSILIRRLSLKNKKLNQHLFPNARQLPTLAQYDPRLFYFEEVNGSLLCTANSGLPLVRYDLKDLGGIFSRNDVNKIFKIHASDVAEEIGKAGLRNAVWNLPFVYVYERSDFTVKLSGANIYADEIRRALQKKELTKDITGKFLMQIKFDKNQDQYMEINIELKAQNNKSSGLEKQIIKSVIDELLVSNSEYAYLYAHLPRKRLTPKIVFWAYEDQTYFRPGGKQRWVKK